MRLLKHFILRRICFNINGIQTVIEAFLGVGFEVFHPAEELLQQNSNIVAANKNR